MTSRYSVDLTEHQAAEMRALLPPGSLRKRPARKKRETEDYLATVNRMLTALGRRAEGDVDALAGLRELVTHAEAVLVAHVAMAKDQGVSWSEIGDRWGTSKQAAQQWFTRATAQTAKSRQPHVDGQATIWEDQP